MEQKRFVQITDEKLKNMETDALRSCIHNIARKVPEDKREKFLQLLEDSFSQNHYGKNDNQPKFKKIMNDDIVNKKLVEIKEFYTKIEDFELCLSATGEEDYSNGYWSSEWIWEYEDDDKIGETIEHAINFGFNCVNDCRYEEALSVFKLIMDNPVFVEDEWGGDSFELELEDLEDEKLVRVNLKTLALNVLYSEYQIQPEENRANALYSYFVYPYVKNISIEEIFSVGREELKDRDKFLQSWIDLLRNQKGETAARLLKEGLLYHKGTDGLLEIARESYNEHPSLYLATLLEYENAHDYEKMKVIGKEALDKLERNLKIRGEIAIKAAQASYCMNDSEFMKKCFYEAFYSNSTMPNYLRLFTSEETIKEYKELAEKRIEEIPVSNRDYYNERINETIENSITDMEKKYLYFFSGHFDKIKSWSMKQKEALGWTGEFIGHGVDLMLLYLYEGEDLRKAVRDIARSILYEVRFSSSKNLVFMKENYIFEKEINIKIDEEIFWNIFCLWKKNYRISKEEIKDYIDWLEAVIDKRIDGIVGGKHRGKYNEVARLAAALGEVKESIGGEMTKKIIINKYMEKYPRHSAFRGEVREYMD